MNKTAILSMLLFLVVVSAGTASAQKDKFLGSFVNVDPNTGGITRLVLNSDDSINVWGRCHPSDCDWGPEKAYAHGATVDTDLRRAADAMTVVYIKNFATKFLIITREKANRIRVDVFTRFTDKSGRSATAHTFVLEREAANP